MLKENKMILRIALFVLSVAAMAAFGLFTPVHAGGAQTPKECELRAFRETFPTTQAATLNCHDQMTAQCQRVLDQWLAAAAVKKRKECGV
jgi:hypothetical protein